MVKERANLHGGLVIKQARLKRGYTQEELADFYSINVRTVRRWENQECDPDFGDVFMICDTILKIDILDAITMAFEAEKQGSEAA